MAERSQVGAEGRERALTVATEVGWALRGVLREYERAQVALARRMGLRPADYAAMSHAIAAEHPVGPAELSEHLGMSTGSATELVDRLESAGHLHRQPHPNDRRRVVLVPEPGSVRRMLGTLRPLVEELDELAGTFEPAEQEAIRRFLRGAENLIAGYAEELRQASR